MLTSYSSDNLNPPIANSGYNFNNTMNNNSSVGNPSGFSGYGSSYNAAENRSKYGSYLDNSLTYDPHKDKKSAFNVVYETNIYNPWGISFFFQILINIFYLFFSRAIR